ncbi:MAG: hypothetical protein BGN99_06345 [Alphaproteobacteria bacterium 65-37]|jgi:hypothetical protein|nr:hypothetical protein [Alphaproteobacteria bacterium]OJU32288.1 MAG: hypothetical protein BGN99_06345 [Alphaproteobacteria bacterium 65-37]
MTDNRHEREEYLEQDDLERETARRRQSIIALAVVVVLVVAGVVLAGRLRAVADLQDCLMTRATNCLEIVAPR